MADTRTMDALEALVAALESALGTLVVFDGPELVGDVPPVAVIVGYDGDPDGDFEAIANWRQTWIGMQSGREVRAESFDIVGCVLAFTGDTDVKIRRRAASDMFGQVNAVLRAPLNRGLGLPPPTTAEFSEGSMRTPQTDRGLEVRIPFTVHVETRV